MKWNFQHRIIILMVMLMMGITGVQAQHGRKHAAFDPQKFQADLEQFIATNAALTPGEAAKFFPMYRQMGKKMRTLLMKCAGSDTSILRTTRRVKRQSADRMR